MLKNKNKFEIINSFFVVRPRTFQSTLVNSQLIKAKINFAKLFKTISSLQNALLSNP